MAWVNGKWVNSGDTATKTGTTTAPTTAAAGSAVTDFRSGQNTANPWNMAGQAGQPRWKPDDWDTAGKDYDRKAYNQKYGTWQQQKDARKWANKQDGLFKKYGGQANFFTSDEYQAFLNQQNQPAPPDAADPAAPPPPAATEEAVPPPAEEALPPEEVVPAVEPDPVSVPGGPGPAADEWGASSPATGGTAVPAIQQVLEGQVATQPDPYTGPNVHVVDTKGEMVKDPRLSDLIQGVQPQQPGQGLPESIKDIGGVTPLPSIGGGAPPPESTKYPGQVGLYPQPAPMPGRRPSPGGPWGQYPMPSQPRPYPWGGWQGYPSRPIGPRRPTPNPYRDYDDTRLYPGGSKDFDETTGVRTGGPGDELREWRRDRRYRTPGQRDRQLQEMYQRILQGRY
jgi:hypothetical protein